MAFAVDDQKISDDGPTVKQALADVATWCELANEAKPLFEALLVRLRTARDEVQRFYDTPHDQLDRNRCLKALKDELVTFSIELQRYFGVRELTETPEAGVQWTEKMFASRVLQHKKLHRKLWEMHGGVHSSESGLDRLFLLLKADEKNYNEWRDPFHAAVKEFKKAVADSVENTDMVDVYKRDALLALEAVTLLRNAKTFSVAYEWIHNEPAKSLYNKLKTLERWGTITLSDWFIPENDISYKKRSRGPRGSFGAIYFGTWASVTNVAVKCLLPASDAGLNKELREAFIKVVDLWFKLSHPYLLKFYGACHVTSPPFFVCEESKEGDLSDVLKRNRRRERDQKSDTQPKMWRLLFQSALAIEYLHGNNIVHGDLKLNKILVGADGYARVAVSLISRYKKPSRDRSLTVPDPDTKLDGAGALRWRAPEALKGKAQIQSDVYSFAMCLIEAIGGKIPYYDVDDDNEVRRRIANRILPEKPTEMDDTIWEWVEKMTVTDLKLRATIKEVIPELMKRANDELERAIDRSICPDCSLKLEDGVTICPRCQRIIFEVGKVKSKEDLPTGIGLLTLIESQQKYPFSNGPDNNDPLDQVDGMLSVDEQLISDDGPTVKQALANMATWCELAEEAKPLFEALLVRLRTARDEVQRFYDTPNDQVDRYRCLKGLKDELVTFSIELQSYFGVRELTATAEPGVRWTEKMFAARVLQHKKLHRKLWEMHGGVHSSESGLDRLFLLLKADEKNHNDWRTPFRAAVKVFEKAVADKVENTTVVDVYNSDTFLALQALTLLRNAEKKNDSDEWESNKPAQRLRDKLANPKDWDTMMLPDWFVPENDIRYDSRAFACGSLGTDHCGTWGARNKVVVKFLRADAGGEQLNDELRKILFHEADLWFKKISHPYVIKVYGVCHVTAVPFFVCEKVGECDLSRVIPRDKSKMWRLLRQSAMAIEYLHSKKIVHGDLRLSNILVGADGYARLAGFGLSRREMPVRHGLVMGGVCDLRWQAPEALENKARVESDVYSFAMCMIEAISGKFPYENFMDDAISDHIRNHILPERPAEMSDYTGIWELILKMTASDPDKRPAMKEVIFVLRQLATSERIYELCRSDLCLTCHTKFENGSLICRMCKYSVDELKSLSSHNLAAIALCDYVREHQEEWISVFEGGAIPILSKILVDENGDVAKVDALKALGCVLVASRLTQNATKYLMANRKIMSALEFEGMLKTLKNFINTGDAYLKTKAIQIVGYWPKREEVTDDQILMSRIRELALQPTDTQLQVAAGRALQFLGEFDSVEINEQEQLPDSQPVPSEVPFTRGTVSSQALTDSVKTSREVVLRRKICVVGSNCAGKTSLIKSILSTGPQLVHVDDRTIGIDHFPVRFLQSTPGAHDTKIHEVVFWDFAGQDAYQVAHSLFFSPRTLFLVCVDLTAFMSAHMQAAIVADDVFQESNLLDEFVERDVMRWIRMILARQPNAELAFVATKEDALAESKGTAQLLKQSLLVKLREVRRMVEKMRQRTTEDRSMQNDFQSDSTAAEVEEDAIEPKIVFASVTSLASVHTTRVRLENLVFESDRSFQIPDTYTRVLSTIVAMREAARTNDMSERIRQMWVPVDLLPAALQIDPTLCRTILRELRDLGDVLWYEDLDIDLFKNTVILDPLLLIELIREVINHKSRDGAISHAGLKYLRFWIALSIPQLKAMKQLLQAFRLIYPAEEDDVMDWNSDLIVPALWQTKTPAACRFLGDLLRIKKTKELEGEAVRVHREYGFEFGLPSSLFDRLLLKSVHPIVKFDVGPDWIMYKDDEFAACRIMVGRDAEALHRTVHVEAVIAETANEEQTNRLHRRFQHLCSAFAAVLREYPRLAGVSTFAWDDNHTMRLNTTDWQIPVWKSVQRMMTIDLNKLKTINDVDSTSKKRAPLEFDPERISQLANQRKKDQQSLLTASKVDNVAAVRALLTMKNVDINCCDELTGRTGLHEAVSRGHLQVVELLLEAKADPNAVDMYEETPLHVAACEDRVQVLELLLKANVNVSATDKLGQTPLHFACAFHANKGVRALLSHGADLDANDSYGRKPLHMCIRSLEHAQVSRRTLLTLQELVAFGATWDDVCDDLIAEGKARQEAPALRLCTLLWAHEHAGGRPLTDIPIEVISRGVSNTQAFIDGIKASREVVLRRKICLVGSSCAGKTSFVKSITSELLQPQLEHVDDRTIGIDHFPLRFEQSIPGQKDATIHEVTFWDFAGQDAYQVAHSLFFSPRTMFLVFVDLQAFAIAYMQAAIFANFEFQETKLLDEFVEDAIKHWIRMVLTRRPDADIVFVATKEDSLSENSVTERLLKDELEKKLRDVQALMEEMKSKVEAEKMQSPARPTDKTLDGTTIEPRVVCVSCTSSDAIRTARTTVEELIIQSELSVHMPDQYSQVLKAIVKIREEAQPLDVAKRINRIFAAVDTLPATLEIDEELCRIILQTLHDLGDVLWYEDLDIALFKNTVILDPMLLIDFIRQVITHKHTGQTMSHAHLKGKDLWIGLPTDDPKLMEAMKQLLQYFHLVYSAAGDRVMYWDSDLIVPAYWQTGIPASWKFLGGKLKVKISKDTSYSDRVRVCWEYHFEHWLPPQLFNQLVVASVTPTFTMKAGPDWIMYEGEKGDTACRIMIDRDLLSLQPTIRIEAVIANAADQTQVAYVWAVFQHLVSTFVVVLSNYKGATVSCCALNEEGEKHNLQGLLLEPPSPLLAMTSKWMPPAETWKFYRRQPN